MSRRWQLFWMVAGISFVGSLPPGVLNTGVAGLTIRQGFVAALVFALGAILSEMAVVRFALVAVVSLPKGKPWHKVLFILIGAVLLLVGVFRKGHATPFSQYPFVAGLALSLLNPLHMPFWLGWRAALRSRKLLGNMTIEYNVFAVALGLGTGLAFALYGFAGRFYLGVQG